MKYRIVNYYFDYKDKRYWFADYDHAMNAACNIMILRLDQLKDEIVKHIVVEYDTEGKSNG